MNTTKMLENIVGPTSEKHKKSKDSVNLLARYFQKRRDAQTVPYNAFLSLTYKTVYTTSSINVCIKVLGMSTMATSHFCFASTIPVKKVDYNTTIFDEESSLPVYICCF